MLSCHTTLDKSLIGKWRNELGSILEITEAIDGILIGRYNSKVGEAENFYELRG